jgi:cyclopropane fatty-acyl-phospholipid synthase-like methyltransferase
MQAPTFHRKQWEYVYILRALEQAYMLQPGMTGLGFGCGKEPLAAVMVKRGVKVTCTDIAPATDGDVFWGSASVKDYFYEGICSWDSFEKRASFRDVNMNEIPDDLGLHDFIWSSCALEHIGSLKHGKDFVIKSLKCLKPGGIAVHTTEYNVLSNDETYESEGLSFFRRRDIDDLIKTLTDYGHKVVPVTYFLGTETLDEHHDLPPYDRERHLKLISDGGFVITSIGLIVVKG